MPALANLADVPNHTMILLIYFLKWLHDIQQIDTSIKVTKLLDRYIFRCCLPLPALATLADVMQMDMILTVLLCPSWPREAGVAQL